MSINRATISGNLTRDGELRSTASGMPVLAFSVAVNDRRKNSQTGEWEDVPNFIDCTMFGTRAQALSQYLTKGTKVAVEGKLRKSRKAFASDVHPRVGLIDGLEAQLSSGAYEGKTIHLCFTCDPYPTGIDWKPTRQVIAMLKDAGCHVQILTKNPSVSQDDWDLLDGEDWVGSTFSGDHHKEPWSDTQGDRLYWLRRAKERGLRTWLSCEPALDPAEVMTMIGEADYIDLFKIGKLNHAKSYIDWASFGRDVEALCKEHGRSYIIKDALRAEMEKGGVS